MRAYVFRRYFEDLFAGDPVALAVTGVFVAFLLIVGLVWLHSLVEQASYKKRMKKRSRQRERGEDERAGF